MALSTILLFVGISGLLLLMQQSRCYPALFEGIGDLQRQARYIADFTAPPTESHRLMVVLDEFDSRLRRLTVESTENDNIVPWQSSLAQDAISGLSMRWRTLYHPELRLTNGTTTSSVGSEAVQAARMLVAELDTISSNASEAAHTQSVLLFMAQVVWLLLGAIVAVVMVMRANRQIMNIAS